VQCCHRPQACSHHHPAIEEGDLFENRRQCFFDDEAGVIVAGGVLMQSLLGPREGSDQRAHHPGVNEVVEHERHRPILEVVATIVNEEKRIGVR
jgi:hypothetical protein